MEFQKIYWAWREFEMRDKIDIFRDLDDLVLCEKNGFKVFNVHAGINDALYEAFIDNYIKTPESIVKLLSKIKEISDAAYEYLCDGFDIIHINECMKFKDISASKQAEKFIKLGDLLIHIRYMFKRIMDETDEEKKMMMLRGMLGM